ncbi:MAG: FxDxF family PEP-CTERM protein [Burkholderiales bacterium]|nr:FxDxF family PEP-CTERM protein [Burkholderiales bacterium]MBH2015532.1 FxDxF family PEP-CTERM protein [Burkholderiales bacterium]
MQIKHIVAAVAVAFTGLAHAGGPVVAPGGDLNVLSVNPTQFAGAYSNESPTAFEATYSFTLATQSNLFGSLAVIEGLPGIDLEPLFFFNVLIDGVATGPLVDLPVGFGFSLANLAAGAHTLTVLGVADRGNSVFTGSVYAQEVSAVPEPASLAMLLAGAGIVGGVAWRRRAV